MLLGNDVVIVTNFDKFRANVIAHDSAGLSFTKLTEDSTHAHGTRIFMPWHKVEYIVLDSPEHERDDTRYLSNVEEKYENQSRS